MPEIKISNTNISKIKLPSNGQREFYWDEDLKGFGVKALNTGLTYIVQKRVGSGRDSKIVRHVIGKANELSASDARDKAAKVLVQLRSGVNLNTEKKQKREQHESEQITLQQIYDAYMAAPDRKLRDATKKLYGNLMKLYLSRDLSSNGSDRELGSMPVLEITDTMIKTKLVILRDEPGEREKRPDRSAQASQCFRLLRSLFNFAADEYAYKGKKVFNRDLLKALPKSKDWNESQTRSVIVYENELKDWYEAVIKLPNSVLRDYILWLMFSGMRRTEAMTLRLSDVNLKNKTVKIRSDAAKTGRERILPLTSILGAIAERRKNDKNSSNIAVINPFLFKGLNAGQHIKEPKRALMAVRKDISKAFSLHDLRRSYASHGSKLIPYPALKELLGHSTGSKKDITMKHYLNLDLESLRPEAEKIAMWLAEKMDMNSAASDAISQ